MKLLLLSLLVLFATSSNIFVRQYDLDFMEPSSNNDKVKLDFFYESLCPYCGQFITSALKTAVATPDFWKICEFNMYPYGNARRQKNGTSWSFTCQHGVRECEGNLIETCAIKKFDWYTQGLPFIVCLEANHNDWISQGKKCAAQFEMDWDVIYKCTTSEEGVGLEVEMAEITEKLQPAHTYVPWMVVNGDHTKSSESAAESNMVRYVCSIYKGPVKIAACQK